MKNNPFLLLLVSTVLFLWACKKDKICNDPTNELCPNFDPCTVVVPANSDFVIIDSTFWSDTLLGIAVDTTLSLTPTFYRAVNLDGMAEYKWKVGTDASTFYGPILNLSFSGFDGNINVTLFTTAMDPYGCLNPDKLMDTITRQIYYRNISAYDAPLWGRYLGHNVGDATEDYEVNAVGLINNLNDSRCLFGLKLPDDCNLEDIGVPLGNSYSFFISEFVNRYTSHRCRNLTVLGQLNKDNRDELRIDYWYDDDAGKRVHEVFVGHRQ